MAETVSFHPTKQLFIDVLTRDISIGNCILDLLDNSADSFTSRSISDTRQVHLSFNEDHFEIKDTCGGIAKKELQERVFRFGMVDFGSHSNTIGVYGIGLKRSIFKLGRMVNFETDDGTDYCKLKIDVNKWLEAGDKNWDLELTETKKSSLDGNKPYTNLRITDLCKEAKDLFRTPKFHNDLKSKISIYYSWFIYEHKIEFDVNKEPISEYEIKLKVSDDYKPVKHEEVFEGVNIQIICWLDIREKDKRAPKEVGGTGWNVYMNNRLIILDDTSDDTGWVGKSPYLPRFHPLFNQFRGIVFLNTNEPYKLPMNTSKDGFNKESRIYLHLLSSMCAIARPLINFLSDKYERSKTQMDDTENSLLQTMSKDFEATGSRFKESTLAELAEDSFVTSFKPPPISIATKKKETSIQYSKSKGRVDLVKKVLNVKSNWEVGSETFEYFWDSEGLDENE